MSFLIGLIVGYIIHKFEARYRSNALLTEVRDERDRLLAANDELYRDYSQLKMRGALPVDDEDMQPWIMDNAHELEVEAARNEQHVATRKIGIDQNRE